MNEVFKFLRLLKKYRLTLIVVPIVTIVITFFLVRNLPNSFQSQVLLATGIVDDTQQAVVGQSLDREKIGQRFSNLMETVRMNQVLDQVSYQLILHDLTSGRPYKALSQQMKDLNSSAKTHAVEVFRDKYQNRQALSLANVDQRGLYELIKSMGYDAPAIRSKLATYRSGESDYITIQFDSESPELSADAANLIASEFIRNYTESTRLRQERANNFLMAELKRRSDTLSQKMEQLRTYKIKNGVLNLTEQSKQLYALLLEYDTKKQEAIQQTSSYAGALNEIDRKFDPSERKYVEAAVSRVNQSIVDTRQELSALYDLYINNDLDEKYKTSYDSLSRKLTAQINKSSDQYITNPLATKQELVTQKLGLEVQLDISRYSINSLENKIRSLNSQFDRLVPKEADVQSLEMSIDIASKEYLDILNRYNQSSLESSFTAKMTVIQEAAPGLAQPSKKMLLVILSGVISFVFCVLVIFGLYFFDQSILTVEELAQATDFPVLGEINQLQSSSIDLNTMWHQDNLPINLVAFKNQLRSVRYEIEQELSDKVLLVTAIRPNTGKTLISLSLAIAWKMANKKVLVIDGNFANPDISKAATAKTFLEDILTNKIAINANPRPGSIEIWSNRAGDASLFELADTDQIVGVFDQIKSVYDIIIVETAALRDYQQAREWFVFSKDVVALHESGCTITTNEKAHLTFLRDTVAFKGWILNKVSPK